MRFAPIRIALCFTLALATAATAPRAHADDDQQAGDAGDADAGARLLDEAFADAFVADDLDALAALYAPDAILFNIGGPPAVGRDAIRGALAGFLAAFDVLAFQYDDPRYQTRGDLSVGWATFQIAVAPRAGGPSFVLSGRSTTVARRVGGDWYYVHDHASLPAPQ